MFGASARVGITSKSKAGAGRMQITLVISHFRGNPKLANLSQRANRGSGLRGAPRDLGLNLIRRSRTRFRSSGARRQCVLDLREVDAAGGEQHVQVVDE